MKEEDKHTEDMDKLFQGAFAQWEPKPAPASWNKVEKELNRKKKKRAAIWWITGIICISLICTALCWKSSNPTDEKRTKSNVSAVSLNKQTDRTVANNSNENDKLQNQAGSPVNNKDNKDAPVDNKQASHTNALVTSSAQEQNNQNSVTSSPVIKKKDNNSIVTSSKSIRVTDDISSASLTKKNSVSTDSHRATQAMQDKTAYAEKETGKANNVNSETKKADQSDTKSFANNSIPTTSVVDINIAKGANTQKSTAKTSADYIENSAKADATQQNGIVKSDAVAETNIDAINSKDPQEKKGSNSSVIKKDSVVQGNNTLTKNDSVKKNQTSPRCSISLYGTPEISQNKVTSTDPNFNIQGAKTNTRFSAGAKFNLKLGKHFELNIGLVYSQYSQSNKLDSAILIKNDTVPYQFVTSMGSMSIPDSSMRPTGTIVFSFFKTFQVYYKYTENVQFINIPINARYSFGKGKFRPYVAAGLNLQYVLAANAYLEVIRDYSTTQIIDKHFTYNSLDVTRFNFGPSADAGLEYRLTDRLDVYVEPNARLNILNLSGSANSLNYFLSCQAGIRIGL